MIIFKPKNSVFSINQFNKILDSFADLRGHQEIQVEVKKKLDCIGEDIIVCLITLRSYNFNIKDNILRIDLAGDVELLKEDLVSLKEVICNYS